MLSTALLRGASAGALIFALAASSARAQEQLPAIDVGAAQPSSGGGDTSGSGWGAGGYGGAGPAQDPFNPSYVLRDASTGTKTDTPIMDTPVNIQSVTQQVLKDQQVTDLSKALQFVSGVTTTNGATSNGNPYDNIVIFADFPRITSTATGSGSTSEARPVLGWALQRRCNSAMSRASRCSRAPPPCSMG